MKEKRYRINGRIHRAYTEKDVRRIREIARQHGHKMELLRRPYRPETHWVAVFHSARNWRRKEAVIVRFLAISRINARVRLIGMGYNLQSLVTLTEDE